MSLSGSPFKSGPLAVDITDTVSSVDMFIDNIITITADNKHWIECAKNTAILVIHSLFRPLQTYEQLKRDDPLSPRKLAEEGEPTERNTCLAWDINTHSLRLFISKDKQTSWFNHTKDALALTKSNTDTLESLVGKLNHASHVIPPAQYFLN